ncbi:ciliary microtubule inner protein 2B-like [Antedon mediterranea]|uniref:ciliary microtubule inner protein 2B-like n=1 Tax=Antedon mediterranea TaxID=105859 RepID=UPI003AF57F52
MMNTDMQNSTTWNIDRRREFSQLKPGTQVPGYNGYIEQYKYHVGDTYGNATSKLAKTYTNHHTIPDTWPIDFKPERQYGGLGLGGPDDTPQSDAPFRLPKSTGDNKLTEKMVPGYMGYIPRMPFKFGNTYKEDCDVCIDDFFNNTRNHDQKIGTLKKSVSLGHRLQPVTSDKVVIRSLNQYRDRNPTGKILLEDKRKFTEAPMPGYRGFIPRQSVTELGLGTRYHEMCEKSLRNFQDSTLLHRTKIKNQLQPNTTLSNSEAKASLQLTTRDDQQGMNQRRIYKPIGMVPKYTGYLPQMRYRFGQTYGDTSRSLPVCAHEQYNYGKYLQTQSV